MVILFECPRKLINKRIPAWLLYAPTVFLSAFLLFQIQPLLSKAMLPSFGGMPAVWTSCVLFFQLGLFGGYAYAHYLVSRVSARRQRLIHLILLALTFLQIPLVLGLEAGALQRERPVFEILKVLLLCVGLPCFALSATSPLLQSWISWEQRGARPYRLYALSNLGSLLALLSYPFVLEPRLDSPEQADVWSFGFFLFALCCAGCALRGLLSGCGTGAAPAKPAASPRPHVSSMVLWLLQCATGSILLLAVTNFVCTDIAAAPFLWVAPLAIYLLSFILCFQGDRWYSRRFYTAALWAFVLVCLPLTPYVLHSGILLVSLSFLVLFLTCMICHGELAKSRPPHDQSSLFYLICAAGGMAGALFVSVGAPFLFSDYLELPLGFELCALVLFLSIMQERYGSCFAREVRGRTIGLTLLVAAGTLGMTAVAFRTDMFRVRNFYGVLRIFETRARTGAPVMRIMQQATTIHGLQYTEPGGRDRPTTYYGPQSGAGLVLSHYLTDAPRKIGVLGLGTGTLACYGREHDRLRFYEINPEVVHAAKIYFSYLKDARAEIEIIEGDARIMLEREAAQNFDILILDVFSGGAIPAHLLTKEAVQVYLRHLSPQGVLVVHVSNQYLDLKPVVWGAAGDLGLACGVIYDAGDEAVGTLPSTYMLLSRSEAAFEIAEIKRAARRDAATSMGRPWTDSRSSILGVLL